MKRIISLLFYVLLKTHCEVCVESFEKRTTLRKTIDITIYLIKQNQNTINNKQSQTTSNI